jgi:hypothetical protein
MTPEEWIAHATETLNQLSAGFCRNEEALLCMKPNVDRDLADIYISDLGYALRDAVLAARKVEGLFSKVSAS